MEGVTGYLTKKYGPLPGYAWAAVLGAGVGLVVLVRRGSGKTAAKPSTSAAATSTPFAPGGIPSYQPASSQPDQNPAGTTATQKVAVLTAQDSGTKYSGFPHQVPLYGISKLVWVAPGTIVRVAAGPGPSGIPVWYLGTQLLADPSDWSASYVDATSAPPGGPAPSGTGGAARTKPASIGSRSSVLMHYAHPDVKRQPRFTHFVQARGGAPGHEGNVHAAAAKAGVHPARLKLLNPHPRGFLRIA